MTSTETYQWCINLLEGSQDAEKKTMLRILLEDKYKFNQADFYIPSPKSIDLALLKQDIKELKEGKPVQHIVGFTFFQGIKIKVNSHVLIPRQETEELVEYLKSIRPGPNSILDICTGSGCIALSLKKHLPKATIDAWDISPEALKVAQENSKELNLQVRFAEQDVFQSWPISHKYDLIVSNPPYVLENEKREMDATVLKYDPALALFVPNDDPLKFYMHISRKAKNILNPKGILAFEINQNFGEEVKALMHTDGYKELKIISDLNKNNRFVIGTTTHQ